MRSFSNARSGPRDASNAFLQQKRRIARSVPSGSRVALLWSGHVPHPTNASRSAGFTLVEVLIAVAIFITIAVGVAQLIAVATRAIRAAREHSSAVILAAAKMDQLRSLAWTYEPPAPGVPSGSAIRSRDRRQPSEPCRGLERDWQASPAGTLGANMPPYVDYLDDAGRWVGHDADPPANAVFIRRWAVWPLPADPERTLVLQVLVTTVRDDRSRAARMEWPHRRRSRCW